MQAVNDTHIKTSPILWIMIGMVAAGGAAWSTYLITQLEGNVEVATATALLALLVMLGGMFPIPVAPRIRAGMTTAPLFAAAIVLGPGCAVIAAVAGGVAYQIALRFRSPGVRARGTRLFSIYRRRRSQPGRPRSSLTGWQTRA